MKKTTLLTLVTLAGFSALAPVLNAKINVLGSDKGVVQVFVKNEDGSPAKHAPVYIIDGRKNLHILKGNEAGSILIDLVIGHYTISSAVTRPIADSIDRYASSSAHIRVMPKDTTTVFLTLHLTEDAISNLSVSTLKKIGVADEVAKYQN